jgi:hypothetical protein
MQLHPIFLHHSSHTHPSFIVTITGRTAASMAICPGTPPLSLLWLKLTCSYNDMVELRVVCSHLTLA